MARDAFEYDVGGELRDRYGRPIYQVVPKHSVPLSSDTSRAYQPTDADGRLQIVLDDQTHISLQAQSGVDRLGNSPSTSALRAAIAEAASIAVDTYGHAHGVTIRTGPGKFLLDGKIQIPDGVTIQGDGYASTVFVTAPGFPDNAVFEPLAIDDTIEAVGLRDFVLYGQTSGSTPTNDQANAGVPTTVQTTVAGSPGVQGHFALVAVGDISGYASSGTLLVGTKRVKYHSVTAATKTFNSCYIVDTGQGSQITAGDAISPITHNNLVGIQMLGVAGQTYVRNVWCQYFTGENMIVGNVNAFDGERLNMASSNRDNILLLPNPGATWLRSITAPYSGVEDVGGTFAGLHVLGQSGTLGFQGFVSIDGLYSELTAHNGIMAWFQNVGSISAQNIYLQGGVDLGDNFPTQVGVQIDSSQANPLTQDGTHAANISLRNIGVAKVGRVLIKDNVRGFVSPANTTVQGTSRTRYDTEAALPIAARTYGASITPNAGQWNTINATNGTAFTIAAPFTPPIDSNAELTIEILNSSGGALGAVTFNAIYKLAGFTWTSPANGLHRYARFNWNGTNWVCVGMSSADY